LIMRSADLILIAEARKAAADGSARRARQNARLTQVEVGKAIGVSGAAVAMYETGQRVPPTEVALAYGRLLRDLAAAGSRVTMTVHDPAAALVASLAEEMGLAC
jgi:DNA-binding XRE family transcriptional regulator